MKADWKVDGEGKIGGGRSRAGGGGGGGLGGAASAGDGSEWKEVAVVHTQIHLSRTPGTRHHRGLLLTKLKLAANWYSC